MLIRYVCKYCGTIHKTRSDALKCEKAAERMKPRFKKDDVVSDEDGYKYKVLWVERWQMDFDKALEKIVAEEYEDLNIPLYHHTFLCVLEALDLEQKDDHIRTSLLPYAILKRPLPLMIKEDDLVPRRKGIMLENECFLKKDNKMRK